ncbi:MAG: hemolysin family protein [Sphaerochaetaceae bacterium]
MLVAIVILLLLSGLFSATETAYTSLSIIDQKILESKHSKSAKIAFQFCKKSDILLTTVLICNNVVNIAASAIVTTYTINRWGNNYVGYATGILTLFLLLFGEISPKQIALNNNMEIALFMAIPLKALTLILFPIVWLFQRFSLLLSIIFRRKGGKKALTVEGLMHLTDAAEDQGVVDEYENGLMQRAIRFSETQVRTVMTHRTEVFCLSDTLTIKEAFPLMVDKGFSRVPIYHRSHENIIGILLLRDLLKAQVEHKENNLIGFLTKKPHFVPEQMHVGDLFFQFKHEKLNMAIVLDEYGGFSGVVSMEDVVEQLFGEIYDEHEKQQGELIVKKAGTAKTYIVQADTPFLQFADTLDLSHRKEDVRIGTLAAYLINKTGDIPKKGDFITTELGTFKVLSMTGNRLDTLEFTPCEDDYE